MLSLHRSSLRALVGGIAALVAAASVGLLARGTPAHAASAAQLQQQIGAGQNRINGLSGTVSAQSNRYGQLGAQASSLQRQIAALQARIAPEVNELFRLRFELSSAKSRLSDLEAVEAEAQSILAQQLVGAYEQDRPDFVTMVLEAKGFQDLLDQLAFEKRIRQQDAQQISIARTARKAVAAQATRLGALELRQQRLTDQVLAQRNQMYRARLGLVNQQIAVGRTRDANARQLAAVRSQVGGLRAQLSKIEAAQAAAAARAAGLPVGGAGIVSGGGFTFPLPKGSAAPPGAWSPDQGVDISAPGGTPARGVLWDDRAPRHRGVRTLGTGSALRWLRRRLQLRVLRPRRAGERACDRDARRGWPGNRRGGAGDRRHLDRPSPRDRVLRLERLATRVWDRGPDALATSRRIRRIAPTPGSAGLQRIYPYLPQRRTLCGSRVDT